MAAISVIVPVYNVEKYLGTCLDSLLGQTFRDVEVICVNDGSTDASGEILKEYAARDVRLKVVSQANAGAGAARNAGLAVASGEYVSFCDPDDWCRKDMLERLHVEAVRLDCDLILSGMRRVEFGTGRTHDMLLAPALLKLERPFAPDQVGRPLFMAGRANPVAKLFRRDFLMRHRLVFQDLPRVNDLYFSFLALAKARRISWVNESFYCYRMGRPGSLQATLRQGERPLCWLEAFRAVRARLAADGEADRFSVALLSTLLGMGVRAMVKLGASDDIALFYRELRQETVDFVAAFGLDGVMLAERERELLELIRRESSPLPVMAALNRESLQEISRLRSRKRLELRERACSLAVRLWRVLKKRLGLDGN